MSSATPRILFVAVETNAAAYLAPLLLRWLNRADSWRLVAGPYANRELGRIADRVPRLETANSPEGAAEAWRRLASDGWAADALVVSAGGHPLEFAALDRFRGLPHAQFIDTWTNYRPRFEGPSGLSVAERIFVIDGNAAREAAEAGLPAERMVMTGQPSWESIAPLSPAPRERALFLSAPVIEGYGSSLGYSERDAWRVVCEARASRPDLLADLSFAPHPIETMPDPHVLLGARLVRYDRALLETTGTILGMFSSPMVDAFLAGRTVVSVQPGAVGADQGPLSRHGHIARVGDAEGLVAALERPKAEGRERLAGSLRNSTDRLERAALELLQ
jgi:hypothetical protein